MATRPYPHHGRNSLAAAVSCVLLLLMMIACTSRPRILVSPDSQPVAEYSYEAGFLAGIQHLSVCEENGAFCRSMLSGMQGRAIGRVRTCVGLTTDTYLFATQKTEKTAARSVVVKRRAFSCNALQTLEKRRWLTLSGEGVEKLLRAKLAKIKIVSGCPTNDFLSFPRHFRSPKFSLF
jgi:hypothetical protein